MAFYELTAVAEEHVAEIFRYSTYEMSSDGVRILAVLHQARRVPPRLFE